MAAPCCRVLESQLGLETVQELGEGGQGVVLLCRDRNSGALFACKVISAHARGDLVQQYRGDDSIERRNGHCLSDRSDMKKLLRRQEDANMDAWLQREVEVLTELSGLPGILPLAATICSEVDGCIHVLTPFCDGGDLLNMMESYTDCDVKLGDRDVALIVLGIARALVSCHSHGIVHCDLKPGNVLLRGRHHHKQGGHKHGAHTANNPTYEDEQQQEDGHRRQGHSAVAELTEQEILLADFGCATRITPGEWLRDSSVGTSCYKAPEMIRGRYDQRVDIWSMGVIMHLLLTDTMPFIHHLRDDASDAEIESAILGNELCLDEYDHLSPSARNLIKGMLCKEPSKRLTLHQVLHHPWLVSNTRPSPIRTSMACLNINHDTIPSLAELCPSPNRPTMATTLGRHSRFQQEESEEEDAMPRFKRVRVHRRSQLHHQHRWHAVPAA